MDYEKINTLLQIWKMAIEINKFHGAAASNEIRILSNIREHTIVELDKIVKKQSAKNEINGQDTDPTVK